MGPGERVVVRLVGGPADGFVFPVPVDKVPARVGVGYPVATYHCDAGYGDVRIFRYVPATRITSLR